MFLLNDFGDKASEFIIRPPDQDKRINILCGATRSGKTTALIPKVVKWLKSYPVAGQRVFTGVSKQTIYQNFLTYLFDFIGPDKYSYNRHSGELTLYDSKWLVIGAKDEGSEKYIRGMTVGIAICDELTLMPKTFYMMLISRMSPAGARLYATTNPDSPYHWVKTEVIDNERLRGDVWYEQLRLDDNPSLSPEFKENAKRSYSGVFYRRMILGEWCLAEGAIYRDCLTEENYYTDETRPPGLRSRGGHVEHWVSCDYGTTNPMVFLDIYDDGQTVWWDREYYWDSKKENRQKTDAEYADDLIRFFIECGATEDQRTWTGVILDPSAASFRAELVSRGIFVMDANNEVDDGIRRVSSMLAQRKIRINRQCVNVIREMQTYSWDEKKSDKGKEQPIKAHDHGPDAGRYHCQTRISDWRLAA